MDQSVGQGGNPRAVMRDLSGMLAAIVRAGADAPDIVCGELCTCQPVDQRCWRLDISAAAVSGDRRIEMRVVMKNGYAVRRDANIELDAGEPIGPRQFEPFKRIFRRQAACAAVPKKSNLFQI